MKLFYHFLFFVCASLILIACANMFASDSKSQAQTDEFTSPRSDGKSTEDTVVAVTQTSPFILTGLKRAASIELNMGFEFEQNCAVKTYSYLYQFQMAMNHLESPQKFK
ncbi:hypothetical protein [Mucilaginibacter flavus]|uniref:hypothetical protein n=1 Tax=Mucilaginibacter flavus TaxID=931504 RepID=UPI0025B4D6C3|nr:hypothetical protein [Mucilaginibacter flavus]MDN3580041.1 hypothetical protein [Mucilaginibacter flavus]